MSIKNEAVRDFSQKVRARYPEAVITVFGSYARGTYTDESDLDICVVLPEMQADDRFAVSDMAWEVSLSHNVHIATVVFPHSAFQQDTADENPFITAIKKEGVAG